MEKEDAIYSITTVIDLLGFSSHLILGNTDIRTKIGAEAVKRLEAIEESIILFEKEREKYPIVYPKNFYYLRFNDALIMGMDLPDQFKPSVGEARKLGITVGEVEKLPNIESFFEGDKSMGEFHEKYFAKEGREVSKFIGLISRIHDYINFREFENNFPGCRTVISTGLRKKYFKKTGEEDYFSINFSFSNAYLAGSKGSKVGITGHQLYLDENIVGIIAQDRYCNNILAYSRFINDPEPPDPFEKEFSERHYKLILSERIKIVLFNKNYYFRKLNSEVLSNLQLLPFIKEKLETFAENQSSANEKITKEFLENIDKRYLQSLKEETPPLDIVNNTKLPRVKYPILGTRLELGYDIDAKLRRLHFE